MRGVVHVVWRGGAPQHMDAGTGTGAQACTLLMRGCERSVLLVDCRYALSAGRGRKCSLKQVQCTWGGPGG